MKVVHYLWIVVLCFSLPAAVFTQPISPLDEETISLDPLLYNGRYYSYYIPSSTKGTPFFNGPDFVPGSVLLRGVRYEQLLLKYDLFNQQLVLQYQIPGGGVKQIILSEAWLESFSLGDQYFEMLSPEANPRQIFQVIGTGSVRVVYSWSKKRELDSSHGATNFVFTGPWKKSYLLNSNTFLPYHHNKSFIALFDPVKQNEVKKYLTGQHINIKKAQDRVIADLVIFCNSISSR